MAKFMINILGTAQDGGYPQIGCKEQCCASAWNNESLARLPSCISLINSTKKKYWLFDVTPEIKKQMQMLDSYDYSLSGVFITHAHIGHYMGLINFGLEVMNLDKIPVYVMPRMKSFLENNSIMDQLISNDNINLIYLNDNGYLFNSIITDNTNNNITSNNGVGSSMNIYNSIKMNKKK